MTIEHLFEFLLLFSILLHVLREREHFGHIFYLNPNSRTFHEISGENIKFKVISRFFTHFSNSRLFPGYPGISGGRGNPDFGATTNLTSHFLGDNFDIFPSTATFFLTPL